ncbi:hypothetical protein DWX71_09945, partial [Ruminococcus bromii]
GNNIVDALLTDKQAKANAYNTQLFFKGAISNKINPTKFDTGNNIVDALLTDKQAKANAYNTQLFFKGAISNKINPTDLCVIIDR